MGSGLVSSFSHPGGNITGVTDVDIDLAQKRLDLLKQALPSLKRVGALGNPSDQVWQPEWKQARAAAEKLDLELLPVLVTSADELESVFTGLNRRVQALLVAPQAFFSVHIDRLVELEYRTKLPAIHEVRLFADSGALMSYGPNPRALLFKTARCRQDLKRGEAG